MENITLLADISELASSLSIATILVFAVLYFMKREKRREDFIERVINKLNLTMQRETLAVLKLAECIERSIDIPHPIMHEIKEDIVKLEREISDAV